MEAVADRRLSLEDIVESMLNSTEVWNLVEKVLRIIHEKLWQEEFRRKREGGSGKEPQLRTDSASPRNALE